MRRVFPSIVAAAFGAVAMFCFMPKPVPAPPPLSATDIGFAQDMSAHHQQAITMSDMVAADAAPEVRALADQIRLTQLREIGQMTGWLQLSGASVVSSHPMAWMMADPSHHMAGGDASVMAMPGMASPADLERLQRAKGRDNEVLFLQLMTRHHQGGVEMAAYVVQHSSTTVVQQTALAMVDEQSQELIFMAFLLEQRGSAPLNYP